MRSARDVEHEAVGVWRDDGCEIPLHPDGEFFQGDAVCVGIGIHHHQIADKGLGFAGDYARLDAFAPCRLVGRQHHAPAAFMTDEDERRIKRRRVRAHRPPEPVGGPVRQEQRYDPLHHSFRPRTRHTLRLWPGSTR